VADRRGTVRVAKRFAPFRIATWGGAEDRIFVVARSTRGREIALTSLVRCALRFREEDGMRQASTIVFCLLIGSCLGLDSEERWAGLFAPYHGARKLCSQSVDGTAGGKPVGITWTAFASTDAPEKVSAFYAKNTSAAKVEKSTHGLTQLRGPKDQLLSVMVAAREGYPTCGVKPAATDRTVIIVSY